MILLENIFITEDFLNSFNLIFYHVILRLKAKNLPKLMTSELKASFSVYNV